LGQKIFGKDKGNLRDAGYDERYSADCQQCNEYKANVRGGKN